jgi:hypothetical protein
MQQADVTLVEAIATQQKDVAIQSTLSARNEVKVRCDENDLLALVCLLPYVST